MRAFQVSQLESLQHYNFLYEKAKGIMSEPMHRCGYCFDEIEDFDCDICEKCQQMLREIQ